MPLDRYRNAALVDGVDVRTLPPVDDTVAEVWRGPLSSCLESPPKMWAFRGLVYDAAGSAYLESGETKVQCSVHGPMEPKRSVLTDAGAEQSRAQLQVYYKLAPFASRRAGRISYQPDDADRRIAVFLQETLTCCLRLDRLPKSRIEVHCLVLEDAGHCLATTVACACLALVDAGLEMYDLVAAGTVCRPVGAADWQQPELVDDSVEVSFVTVAYMRNLRQVAGLLIDAAEPLQPSEAETACRMCVEPCKLALDFLRRHLLDGLRPASADADGDEIMEQ